MIFLLIFGLVYGAMNTYFGRRTRQWLHALAPSRVPGWLFWTVFWLLASCLFLARFLAGRAPMAVTGLLSQIGGYWLAVLVYAVLLLALVDLIRGLDRWTGLLAAWKRPRQAKIRFTGAAVGAVLLALLVYGTWRARTPVVTEYALTIPRSAGSYRDLSIVLVSDTHLGYTNGTGRIQELVAMVNGLQPDLVLIAGDLIDDDIQPFLAEGMAAELSRLQSRLGTYAIMGNHDVRSPELAAFRAELERAGIQLLIDSWVTVDDSIVLAGRDDIGGPRTTGDVVAVPLADILQGADRALPLLVMDHNPIRFADAVAAGADLQVSGHTHAGQIFPFTLITGLTYDQQWGTLKQGNSQLLVSSGFGTWGPPIRIGTRPEVVRIRIAFVPPDGS